MSLNCIYVVTEAESVVARFVYADDAIVWCQAATEREPERELNLTDKAGYYNIWYGGTH